MSAAPKIGDPGWVPEPEPTLEDDDLGDLGAPRCDLGVTEVQTTSVTSVTSVTRVTEVEGVVVDATQLASSVDATEDAQDSWRPVSLVGVGPVEPPSICGLLYPGKRHLLSGKSDSGKSMSVHVIQ